MSGAESLTVVLTSGSLAPDDMAGLTATIERLISMGSMAVPSKVPVGRVTSVVVSFGPCDPASVPMSLSNLIAAGNLSQFAPRVIL